ncbi:hypothetical protein GCM10020255_036450 [Rhodococcus baikonurensis]
MTARGRNFIDPARDALAALDRLVIDSESVLSAFPHLSVATTASLADDPTAVLLGALRTKVPNLRITISDPPGSSVADAIHPVMAAQRTWQSWSRRLPVSPGRESFVFRTTTCDSSARPALQPRLTECSLAKT